MPGLPWAISSKRLHTFKPNVCFESLAISPMSENAWEKKEDKLTSVDIALQVLDNVIMTRWKVLPRDQCQGKNYNDLRGFVPAY